MGLAGPGAGVEQTGFAGGDRPPCLPLEGEGLPAARGEPGIDSLFW
jgi:hypothetical protein